GLPFAGFCPFLGLRFRRFAGRPRVANSRVGKSGAAPDMTDRRQANAWAVRPCLLLVGTGLLLAGCQSQSGLTDFNVNPVPGSAVNITSLTEVVNKNPRDAAAYNVRGTAYGESGKFNEALADFNRALELDPGFYQVYAN